MVFDLKPLFNENVKKIDVSLDIDKSHYDSLRDEQWDGVTANGSFEKIDGIITLNLEIHCKLNALCDRCASDINKEYRLKISEKLTDKKPESQDSDLLFAKKQEINLEDIIISAILLSKPSKFLCDISCKGLCPDCGRNLNTEKCDCGQDNGDSRWDALKELLK